MPVVEPHEERPVRLVVRDDSLERSRITVLFRFVLALPLVVWVTLRGLAAFVVAVGNWLAVLIERQVPSSLHDFVASYVRYATQVSAYVFLAANPYPWFRCQEDYPVDLEIAPPERQSRWSGLFRLPLALPAILLALVLGGGLIVGGSDTWSASQGAVGASFTYALSTAGGAAAAAAFLSWFAILALGRAPRGLRDLVLFAFSYAAQTSAYALLLTPRYPTSSPTRAEPFSRLPAHPVRLVIADDLERPRLTVLFRLLLAVPHLVWLTLWSVAAVFAALAAWAAALVAGRVPVPLRRFLSAYVRYGAHLSAFLYLVGRRFPGFTGREGSYGIDIAVEPADRQSRWKTLFRLPLAVPAFILAGALGGVLLVVGFLGWWYALVTRRMPEGLRDLGASCIRYSAQTYAFALLLTDRYPYAAPVLRERPRDVQPVLGDDLPGDAF